MPLYILNAEFELKTGLQFNHSFSKYFARTPVVLLKFFYTPKALNQDGQSYLGRVVIKGSVPDFWWLFQPFWFGFYVNLLSGDLER